MKTIRILAAAGVLAVLGIFPLASQIQFDIGLNVPIFAGLVTEEETYEELLEYAVLVPDVKMHYFWGDETFRIGAGFRAYTLILMSLMYPTVTAEADVSNFRFTGSVGGGAFLAFGLVSDFATAQVWLPEVSAAYKVNDWLHVGAGATALAVFNDSIFTNTVPYAAYGFVRFSLGGPQGM